MSFVRSGRGDHHAPEWLPAARVALWSLALGVIVLYAFFAVLGAIDPTRDVSVTVVVAVLVALWLVHAWLERRHGDARAVHHDRERRGF